MTQWKKEKSIGGLIIPSYINIKQVRPIDNIIAYITYKELFPAKSNTFDEIKTEFAKYFRDDIVQSIIKTSYIIGEKYGWSNLSSSTVAFDMLRKVDPKILSVLKENRIFFSRQQMLASVKLALLYSSPDIHSSLIKDHFDDLGELIFRITDHLDDETVSDPDSLRVNVLRNLIFNSGFDLPLAVSRYSYIFNDLIGPKYNGKTVNELFKDFFGIDFNFYLAIGFSIYGFYDKHNFEKRLSSPAEFNFSDHYFANTNIYTKENYQKVTSLISGTCQSLKDELVSEERANGKFFSYQAFFRKPIIYNKPVYYLLDKKYLAKRITVGSFWQILDHLKTDEEKQTFKGIWGKLFERYAYELTIDVYKDKTRVLSEIVGDNTYGVDLIIHYPNTLVLIEVTTRKIPYNTWIDANPSTIKQQLFNLLIGTNKRGKAMQLFELWKGIKQKNVTLDSIDISSIHRVIPIIVFEDTVPVHEGCWNLYSKILTDNEIDNEFAADLLFWDIEEYEYALAYVEEGQSIPQIIDNQIRTNFKHNPFSNYLIFSGQTMKRSKFVERLFKKYTNNLTSTLFR